MQECLKAQKSQEIPEKSKHLSQKKNILEPRECQIGGSSDALISIFYLYDYLYFLNNMFIIILDFLIKLVRIEENCH